MNISMSKYAYDSGSIIHAEWEPISSAHGYLIEVWKDNKQLKSYFTDAGQLSYEQKLSEVGKYSIFVSAIDSNNKYFATNSTTFYIAKAAEKPIVKANQITYNNKPTICLKWNAVENADDYLVEIWQNGAQLFSDNIGTLTEYTRILPSGNYTAYVSSHNPLGYFMSEGINFNIELDSPKVSASSIIYTTENPISLKWNSVPGADSYLVEIWKDGVQKYTDNFGNLLYYERYLYEPGRYEIYVTPHDVGGYAKVNNPIYIDIKSKIDLSENECTVDFYSFGGEQVNSLIAIKDSLITQPTYPKWDGYIFDGWYKEYECINEWDFFYEKITQNTILYAKWQPIPYTESIISKTENGCSANIKLYNIPESSKIIVTGYKDKKFVTMQTIDYTKDSETIELTGNIDNVKVMVWSSLSSLKPLTGVEEIPSNQWITE